MSRGKPVFYSGESDGRLRVQKNMSVKRVGGGNFVRHTEVVRVKLLQAIGDTVPVQAAVLRVVDRQCPLSRLRVCYHGISPFSCYMLPVLP